MPEVDLRIAFREGLGVNWPTHILTPDRRAAITSQSRAVPLRQIIGGILIEEGEAMLGKYARSIGPRISSPRREMQLQAVTAFMRVGEIMTWTDYDAGDAESLVIDPRGNDLIRRRIVEAKRSTHIANKRQIVPEVEGLSRGLGRYRELYNQAVFTGAKPDRVPARVSVTARIKRKARIIFG